MIRNSVSVLFIIACVIFGAGESQCLIVGPARLDVRLPAGERTDITYYAQNDTGEPIHVTVEPENWAGASYNYDGLAAGDWIKPDPREFDLKPKEIKKIKMTVRVPKKSVGELVSQIFFTSTPVGTDGTQPGGVRARLGAILYVAVKGTEKPEVKMVDIQLTNVPGSAESDLTIGVVVDNTGNVHIRPSSGAVKIEDSGGQRVALINIVTEYPVLPKKLYTYSTVWSKPQIKEGKYRATAEMKYGRIFGREKAVKLAKEFEIDNTGKVIVK